MKPKNGFPLLIAIAMILSLAPGAAHAAQQKDAPSPPATPTTTWVPYKLTYTLTEMNGTKRVGSQRYTIVVDASSSPFDSSRRRSAHLKLGSRIPISTGGGPGSTGNQTAYIDIGMKIDATLRLVDKGLALSTQVTESSIDHAQQPRAAENAPVIRQASFETTTLLNANKPTVIGNVDIPGATRTLQIQVEAAKLQ